MTTTECTVALSGRHQFNPKVIGRGPDKRTVYQCVCGRPAPDKKAVKVALKATSRERKKQREESKRLTGAKRMIANHEAAKQQGLI